MADVLVDFGVQLYVPWQLTQGKVLYRDIAHYTGPLSVYYNALAFRIFGANLRVLELANLPILIGIVVAIYYLALRLGGRLCAAVCGISFLMLFAFAHLSIAGNYNLCAPTNTNTRTPCSLPGLRDISRIARDPRGRMLDSAIAGFLAGMIFLTRSEFFVAIIGAAMVGMLLLAASYRIARVAIICINSSSPRLLPPLISAIPAATWPCRGIWRFTERWACGRQS